MEFGLAPDADDATDTLETVAVDCFSETVAAECFSEIVAFAIVLVGAVSVCAAAG